MNLSLNQFEVLESIEKNQTNKITQRDIAQSKFIALGTVNKVIKELIDMELIIIDDENKYSLTLKGYNYLEPFKVKKAIFIAAGFGSRLVPITLNTPKPLIKVHGKRIIETLLDAVVEKGITDITIVRGYLSEQFDVLKNKYPTIKFIDNPIYNESNNITSINLVRDMLSNAYVFESDLLLSNNNLIRKYEYHTNYLGIYKDVTDDWCFDVKGNIIQDVSVGGRDTYQMVGISYWSKDDALKMQEDVASVLKMPGGREKYWDEVALRVFKKHYNIMLRQCLSEDIVEIDTFNELKQIDKIYDC